MGEIRWRRVCIGGRRVVRREEVGYGAVYPLCTWKRLAKRATAVVVTDSKGAGGREQQGRARRSQMGV